MNMQITTDIFILWAFNNSKDEEKEALERWKKECIITSEINRKKVGCKVMPVSKVCMKVEIKENSLLFLKHNNNCSEKIKVTSDKRFLFVHGPGDIENIQKLARFLNVLPYSSSDIPYYNRLLTDVNNCKSKEEFVKIAYSWINFYYNHFVIDVFRRVKHRALNLFASINVDIQTIHELWGKKEFFQLDRIANELYEQWQGNEENLSINSPNKQLERLWFLLLGEKIPVCLNENDLLADLLLITDSDGSIKSVREWLDKLPVGPIDDKDTPWQFWEELLDLCGIKIMVSSNQKIYYSPKSFSAIRSFLAVLPMIVKDPSRCISLIIKKGNKCLSNLNLEKPKKEILKELIQYKPLDIFWHFLHFAEYNINNIQLREIKPLEVLDKIPQFIINNERLRIFEKSKIETFADWMNKLGNAFDELRESLNK